MASKRVVEVGNRVLTTKDVEEVVFQNKGVSLSGAALEKVEESFSFLKRFSKGKLIYGINTGFGPMAQYKIKDSDLQQLQYNLIRSHCAGTGNLLGQMESRSVLLARLNSLMMGCSGVSPELVHLLAELINRRVYPCIYEHGGVGASGDLVQLAHVALVLIGEGQVWFRDKIANTSEVFKSQGITPLQIHLREGIAVLNGTSTMTGLGAMNVIQAYKLLNWSVTFSGMINEVVEAFDDHYSLALNKLKPHPGQQRIADAMTKVTSGSKLIRKRNESLYQSSNIENQDILKEKVQEYYSIRCVPQILGPVLDTLIYANTVVMHEMNSVNDNPIISPQDANVFHGGNFHGDYVALEMDKMRIAVTKMIMLAERQLNYLLNDKLNQKLPPFLNLGILGLNYGMQGMQFTATSTTAECQTLSNPMYIHSIPNNNDNQDIVSMGTNAALLTARVIQNGFDVLAIQAIAVCQAIASQRSKDKLSPISRQMFSELREKCEVFQEDSTKYECIANVSKFLKERSLPYLES